MGEWINVSYKAPCPICNRPDWCARSADGRVSVCRRQGGDGAIERTGKSGTYYLYFDDNSAPRREAPELPPVPQPERADAMTLDRVYRGLLAVLPLEAKHRQDLHRRGLNDNQIQRFGYKSHLLHGRARIAKRIQDQFGSVVVSRVPGFIERETDRRWYSTLAGSPGMLIPVRSLDGAITGLVIRCDDPGESGRYRWLSSRSYGGPGPETAAHVPLHTGDTRTVRVSEGPLKGDCATVLSGVLTIGLPGVAAWRLCLPILERLRPELILLSFDSDWRTNAAVARSLGACAWELNRLGHAVKMEIWCSDRGKGIDDLFRAGYEPEIRNWMSALAAEKRGTARSIQRSA